MGILNRVLNSGSSVIGSIPIWSYQDFTNVTGTSLAITQDNNTTDSPIALTDTSKIVSNSAVVVLTNNEYAYPYTSGYSMIFFNILSKVVDADNTLQNITLSGIPDASFKDNIRVWYMRQCAFNQLPVGRRLPSGNAILKIKAINVAGLASSSETKNSSIVNSIIFG